MNTSTTIGRLMSVTEFFNTYSVEIPRIQRDYTYGSKTEKTEQVLNKILSDIHTALTENKELVFDFIYGCTANNNSFQPLDGQQRLTTLFLLYFYAALIGHKRLNVTFIYSTRDDTTIFCKELMREFTYSENNGENLSLSQQIKDSAFYRPSFDDDPSIRSMLVVLDRIESKFDDFKKPDNPCYFWEILNNQETCPLKFYCLDIGKFSLSDDLYIKMNARGKQLTEYEIFKSKFEKYIETLDKDLMYQVAQKMDNEYSDLLWEIMDNDKKKIDDAFVYLFKNLFNIINFKNKEEKIKLNYSKKSLYQNFEDLKIQSDDILLMLDIIDVFVDINRITPNWCNVYFYKSESVLASDTTKIRFFKSDINPFIPACKGVLNNPQLVSLYAVYVAYKTYKESQDDNKWRDNLRHIRNLIEFSDDELGHPERIPSMLTEIEMIMNGKIRTITKSQFNSIQFNEEIEKENESNFWGQLYEYEDHYLLRGSLALFSKSNEFNISDFNEQSTILTRLNTFISIFDNSSIGKDREIRANLLKYGDFSQRHKKDINNRMFGFSYDSWRYIFTTSSYYPYRQIMSVIDKYPTNPQTPSINEWRYYASCNNYYNYTYVAYNSPSYGFYFFEEYHNKPLEVWLLQSSAHGDSNVMWKMLNLILKKELDGLKCKVSLDKYKTNHEVIVERMFSIDITQEGWKITDLTEDRKIDNWLSANFASEYIDGILKHTNIDYIIRMKNVISQMITNGMLTKSL